jgi:hypothetical protein
MHWAKYTQRGYLAQANKCHACATDLPKRRSMGHRDTSWLEDITVYQQGVEIIPFSTDIPYGVLIHFPSRTEVLSKGSVH